ncbi:PRC-barrel domain-containing protein [Candidatus Uhrbacteria bacterium]|nr:PRC-barrel domain-containing protein [Candidatus Uhrbacteria bacterium]
MRLSDDQLRSLPVETTAGEYVGRITGFVVDTQGGVVVQYRVRPPGILATLLSSRELLINQSQVVSIDANRMVVESGHTPERSPAVERSFTAGRSGGRRRRALAPSPHPQPLTANRE